MNKSTLITAMMLIWAILLTACAPSQLAEPAAPTSTKPPLATKPAALATAVAPTKILPTPKPTRNPTVTPAPTAPNEAPAKEIIESEGELLIIFGRNGGYAGVEEEQQIYSNGRISNEKDQTWQSTPDEVSQLLEDIVATGFMALEKSYIPKSACCDHFTYIITVTYQGETRQVTTVDGAPNTPEAFWKTQILIQDFLKAKKI